MFCFHLGPGGNATGLGDYVARLDAAGIPVLIMSADMMPTDFQTVAANSSVPHTIIFRRSVPHEGSVPPSDDPDVPRYELSPQAACEEHLGWHLAHLPPELDPSVTWIADINEPDKERSEWLAAYSLYAARKCDQLGYKYVALNWSVGTPRNGSIVNGVQEEDAWFKPNMQALIAYAKQHKHNFAFGLHEYSLVTYDILHNLGDYVGRICKALDKLSMPDINVFITEFGWTYQEVPDPETAMRHIREAFALYSKYPQIKGASIWYLGPGFGNIANKAQKLIAPLGDLMIELDYHPTDPPPPDKRLGDAREPYSRVYNRVSSKATLDQWLSVCKEAYLNRQTVGFSNDDAGIGVGLKSKTVVEWGGEFAQAVINNWYEIEYGVRNVTHKPFPGGVITPPPPPTSKVLRGLHASADPGDFWGGQQEIQEFANLNPGVIKIMNAHSADSIGQLGRACRGKKWIVRLFQVMTNVVTPQQFYNYTINDTSRTVQVLRSLEVPDEDIIIEIHNEPNLRQEGWGINWLDGTMFNDWYISVLNLYKQSFPNCKFMFPGLSPGSFVEDIRYDSTQFLLQCTQAIALSDALGVHGYWSKTYPMSSTLVHIKSHEKFNKPIWVTEASFNEKEMMPTEYIVAEYARFIKSLANISLVRGVTFFVASASNPTFRFEAWVTKTSTRNIGQQLHQALGD